MSEIFNPVVSCIRPASRMRLASLFFQLSR